MYVKDNFLFFLQATCRRAQNEIIDAGLLRSVKKPSRGSSLRRGRIVWFLFRAYPKTRSVFVRVRLCQSVSHVFG